MRRYAVLGSLLALLIGFGSGSARSQAPSAPRAMAVDQATLIQQVNAALAAKDWAAAIAPLQHLIAVNPSNWQFYSALGDAQLNIGFLDQAVAAYEKGVEAADRLTTVDPSNPLTDPAKKQAGTAKMLTNAGNAYLKLHNNKAAIDAFTRAASRDPNPAVVYFNLCATQYNTGNVEGALDACDKAIAADPTKADAYFIKGSLLIAGSKTEKDGTVTPPPGTAEALKKYLALAPDGAHAADVRQMLAYAGVKGADDSDACDRESGDDAIAACTRVIQDATRSAKIRAAAYLGRGEAEDQTKHDPARAIRDYDQAIALDPGNAETFNHRGLAYTHVGQMDRAMRDYAAAIYLKPDYAGAFVNRGIAYEKQNLHDRAIQDYDQAIRLKPDYALAFNNRGNSYFNKGDYDRAIRDYDEAIRIDRTYPDPYNNRGLAKLKKGDTAGGNADLARAKQLNPKGGE